MTSAIIWASALAFSLTGVSCTVSASDTDLVCGENCDSAEEEVERCLEFLPQCPTDTFVLGSPDSTESTSIDLRWRKVSECDSSVGEWVYAIVPDDIISLSITVEAGNNSVALASLSLDGEQLIDWESEDSGAWGNAPLYHGPGIASSIVLPLNAGTRPRPGCLAILPVNQTPRGEGRAHAGTLQITARRGDPSDLDDTEIDLNLVVLDGVEISEEQLQEAAEQMRSVYKRAGAVKVGSVKVYENFAGGSTIVDTKEEEMAALRSMPVDPTRPNALNVFFITDFTEPGFFGDAAGIPGALGAQETGGSGIIMAVETHMVQETEDGEFLLDTELLGQVLAHEVGHQMGLYHTSESDGSGHDLFSDTPECDASFDGNDDGELTGDECLGRGTENIMFWISEDGVEQVTLSPQQAEQTKSTPIGR